LGQDNTEPRRIIAVSAQTCDWAGYKCDALQPANPFSESGRKYKILILAGHSGVATRAMSLLLTHEEPWCLDAFYGLDQEIAVMGSPLAAVIEVSYKRLSGHDGIGDEREIDAEPRSIRVRTALPLKA